MGENGYQIVSVSQAEARRGGLLSHWPLFHSTDLAFAFDLGNTIAGYDLEACYAGMPADGPDAEASWWVPDGWEELRAGMISPGRYFRVLASPGVAIGDAGGDVVRILIWDLTPQQD